VSMMKAILSYVILHDTRMSDNTYENVHRSPQGM
jgi:hypothetical protein